MNESKDYDWQHVESSHIKALHFDSTGTISCRWGPYVYGYLYVAFKNGNIYQYAGISVSDYNAILSAASVGSALYNLVTIVQEGTLVDKMARERETETQQEGGR